MQRPTVTVLNCPSYNDSEITAALLKQFELLGGIDKFVRPGDNVLIKPNLIAPRPPKYPTQTAPAVILQTARILKEYGAKPFVGDSSAWGNAEACIKALGINEQLRKLGIPVKQLNKPKICTIGKNTQVGISSPALEADVIINLPKFKSHQQFVATFAIKNMFGCVSGKQKSLWHFRKGKDPSEFCEFLIDIYKYLNPALTIIDAVVAMEGPGPILGRNRELGWLISGSDPFACEAVCAKLVGIDPFKLPIIQKAEKMESASLNIEDISILGDDFTNKICHDFAWPELIPVRFSLPHVCKSIVKQIVYVIKSKLQK